MRLEDSTQAMRKHLFQSFCSKVANVAKLIFSVVLLIIHAVLYLLLFFVMLSSSGRGEERKQAQDPMPETTVTSPTGNNPASTAPVRVRVSGEYALRVLLHNERVQRTQIELQRLTQQLQQSIQALCLNQTSRPDCRIVQLMEEEVIVEKKGEEKKGEEKKGEEKKGEER